MDIKFNIVFNDFEKRINTQYLYSIEQAIDHYDWVIGNWARIEGIRYISIYVDNKPTTYGDLKIMDLLGIKL